MNYAINYNLVRMGHVVLLLLIVSHWFACVWGLQTSFQDSHATTWVGEFGYCTPLPDPGLVGRTNLSAAAALPSAAHDGAVDGAQDGATDGRVLFECRTAFALYVASLYWAVMTITSIG